jgi:hypothetical protein
MAVVRSHSATAAATAIYAYLLPRMAEDQKLDPQKDIQRIIAPMRGGRRYSQVKAEIAEACRTVTQGRLAMDADIEDVARMLDAIESVVSDPGSAVPTGLGAENGEMNVPPGPQMTPPNAPPVNPPEDLSRDNGQVPPAVPPAAGGGMGDILMQVRDFIAAHVAPEVLAQFDQLVGGQAGATPPAAPPMDPAAAAPPAAAEVPAAPEAEAPPMDPEAAAAAEEPDDGEEPAAAEPGAEEPDAPPAEEPDEEEDEEEDDGMSKDQKTGLPSPGGAMDGKTYVTKVAMDAAIKAARAEERQTQRDIQAALEKVRPRVGVLRMAFDSAPDVYKHALMALGVQNVDKIKDTAAYEIIFDSQPRPSPQPVPQLAADSAVPEGTPSFSERFKSTGRIAHM